eukprot:s5481_g1.t1
METRAVSRVFSSSKASFAVSLEFVEYLKVRNACNVEGTEEAERNASEGYRLWINGLFAWHTSHPEMSLHFLQIATLWFDSKQVKLTSTAIELCRAVRYQGIRDLTLPLANSLLGVLHADMEPQVRLCILELLKNCQAVYPRLNVKLVLELLESVISGKESLEEREVRFQVRRVAAYMLEAILQDDQAFARANIKLTSIALTDGKRNTDETAAKNQALICLLKETLRS